MKARLHLLLSRLASEGGVANSRGYVIRDQLTHDELARLVGGCRHVAVTRAPWQLQREGVIVRSGQRIIVRPGAPDATPRRVTAVNDQRQLFG